MAVKAWEALEKQTDLNLTDLAEEREEECFTFRTNYSAAKNSDYFPCLYVVLKKGDDVIHHLQPMLND